MSDWPQGWREATLKASGITVTPFALDVLSAWRRSTPLVPVTYNPLGMPARGTSNVRYLGTAYALFPGITAFSAAMALFLASPRGAGVRHALEAAERHSDAWRAVHALGWPATATETDYPSALLDMVEQRYRDKLASRDTARRRTAGTQKAAPDVHEGARHQAVILHHAAANISDARQAIQFVLRGLK